MPYFAFVMHAGGDIDEGRGFATEREADAFGLERTAYDELTPKDDPQHWEKHDPPVILVFEMIDISEKTLQSGKYTRPVAIYQRGEKYACVKGPTHQAKE